METTTQQSSIQRMDIHQTVTDTIIRQLESGTVPWHQPWTGGNTTALQIPQNKTTGKQYRGINILLLWTAMQNKKLTTHEWASFKQWQAKGETIRKGEKGTMIVYYDTLEVEQDNELKKIPFLKYSLVFNRSQLVNYQPDDITTPTATSIVERIAAADTFVHNTNAVIQHHDGGACYIPSSDRVMMPFTDRFIDTPNCTATEGYYAALMHELTHWTGSKGRLHRNVGKKFGDKYYAEEELVAELGAAFLCAGFGIATPGHEHNASYIDHWLKVLKENKHAVITAASEASKAVDYLHGLQNG
jgi:antirestriction protein ArdC